MDDDKRDGQEQALMELSQKVEASLQPAIDSHVQTFQPKQGLDFLHVKNSLLLTYLIELTRYNQDKNPESKRRLTEMKIAMDKLRGLDKKLRYQIDKLLASTTNFASSEDPLQLRPNIQVDDESDSGDDEQEEEEEKANNADDSEGDDESTEADIDTDLAAARQTLDNSRTSRPTEDLVYQAPRHTAVPYVEDRKLEKEKRRLKKLRNSELAETLKYQYGDQPETDDIAGGMQMGRQNSESRRFTEFEKERTKFEEDNFLRLPVSRKEKQARKRMMREEASNLNAIADVGKILREEEPSFLGKKKRKKGGKRRR